jgi:hypothetical protein
MKLILRDDSGDTEYEGQVTLVTDRPEILGMSDMSCGYYAKRTVVVEFDYTNGRSDL